MCCVPPFLRGNSAAAAPRQPVVRRCRTVVAAAIVSFSIFLSIPSLCPRPPPLPVPPFAGGYCSTVEVFAAPHRRVHVRSLPARIARCLLAAPASSSVFCQAEEQARAKAAAAVTMQRLVRGHLGRLRGQKHRQQLIIKVMWCRNCDRPEPGGGRCKFCGRKLATIEKLPHELRREGIASKTFTYYGFNHCFSRKFTATTALAAVAAAAAQGRGTGPGGAAAVARGTPPAHQVRPAPTGPGPHSSSRARMASFVLVEVPHPDQTPINNRASLQAAREDDDFDRRRYMVEHLAVRTEQQQQQEPQQQPPQQQQQQQQQHQQPASSGAVGPLTVFLREDLLLRDRAGGTNAAALKQHVHAVTAAAAGRKGSFDEKISLQPWQVLQHPKMVTTNVERMQLWNHAQALLHAWDIVAAFLHEKRLRAAQCEVRAAAAVSGTQLAAAVAQPGSSSSAANVKPGNGKRNAGAVPPLARNARTPPAAGVGVGVGGGDPAVLAPAFAFAPLDSAAAATILPVDCVRVVKLCSSFCWLAAFRTPEAVLRSVARRILCYSDGARHWPAVLRAFEDAAAVFEAGPQALLLELAELHDLFERAGERTRFYNELFLTDFVCWVDQLQPQQQQQQQQLAPATAGAAAGAEATLAAAARELRQAMRAFRKADTGFPLEQLEADAAQSALLLQGVGGSRGSSSSSSSSSSNNNNNSGSSSGARPPPAADNDAEAAWAKQYLQMRQLDMAPKKPNF